MIHDSYGAPLGRSRKGAWIEMLQEKTQGLRKGGRSRKGAWIEIESAQSAANAEKRSLPQGSVD